MPKELEEMLEDDTPEYDEEEETTTEEAEVETEEETETVEEAEGESEEEETEEETETAAEEFDEIIYNGKTVRIPVSERKDYLQRGYNYAKLSGELDAARRELSDLKRVIGDMEAATGKSFADVSKELRTQALETKAYEMGIEPAVLAEQMELKSKISRMEAELYRQRRETSITAEKAKLKDKPFFGDLEADIDAMLEQSPELSAEAAYIFLRGERFDELMEKAKNKTAQRVTAEYQDRSKRTTPAAEKSKKPQYSPVVQDLARKMGLKV